MRSSSLWGTLSSIIKRHTMIDIKKFKEYKDYVREGLVKDRFLNGKYIQVGALSKKRFNQSSTLQIVASYLLLKLTLRNSL